MPKRILASSFAPPGLSPPVSSSLSLSLDDTLLQESEDMARRREPVAVGAIGAAAGTGADGSEVGGGRWKGFVSFCSSGADVAAAGSLETMRLKKGFLLSVGGETTVDGGGDFTDGSSDVETAGTEGADTAGADGGLRVASAGLGSSWLAVGVSSFGVNC